MDPCLITTVIPFSQALHAEVNAEIFRISGQADVRTRLDQGEFVHFLSIVAVGEACPAEDWPASQGDARALGAWRARPARKQTSVGDDQAYVLVEITADGSLEQATAQLVDAFGGDITAVLRTARKWDQEWDPKRPQPLTDFLLEHHCPIRAGWTWNNWLRRRQRRNRVGQTHVGTPGMSVWRIKRECELAAWIEAQLETLRGGQIWTDASPLQRLELVRQRVWQRQQSSGDAKWAFSAESAPCLQADPANPWNDSGYDIHNSQALRALAAIVHGFAWPAYVPLALVVTGLAWAWAGTQPIGLSGLALGLSALAGATVALIVRLRRHFTWELATAGVAAVVLSWLGLIWHDNHAAFELIVLVVPKSVVAVLAASAALAYALYRRLLHLERNDAVEHVVPPSDQIRALMEQENRPGCVQNHMATVSRLKAGWIRRLALRLAFVVVGTGHFVGRPGFLGKNGVIHFARWMRLPGTDLLMFWSNFDGTWESYVADFIADAPSGVTAIWSNCVGFPRTKGLFSDGADDRDRLVNWARRQQQPTLFWYCAYPDLTTDRIRTNAAIRQGLASAASDDDARDWLSLFGSSQRPADSLDVAEIPTPIFGALSTRPAANMLLVRLSGQPAMARGWLRAVQARITFGEARPGQPAIVLGLAASALARLDLPAPAMATFPTAFQQGMWEEWRARALGDTGDNKPSAWTWGGTDEATRPDVILLVYAYAVDAKDPLSLESQVAALRALSATHGAHVFECIDLDSPAGLPGTRRRPAASPDAANGSFGFMDGISQPVIRGAPRAGGNAVASDLVSPGELVLGYPDNTGRLPPSPTLMASHDPFHDLPNAGTDPFRRRPEFSRYEAATGFRDLGINGTFLVVRQLKEEEDAFDKWCEQTYVEMKERQVDIDFDADRRDASVRTADARPALDAPSPGGRSQENKARLVAALLVGRWPDGSSLVRNPRSPATIGAPGARPDNAFRYGLEDPRGYACPFGAHTRRANPRDTRFHATREESDEEIQAVNRHRILRIGRPYGNARRLQDGSGKGLMFMCLNADIERQFEFVQKTWLLNPNIHGLQGEIDPLIGRGEHRQFTVPTPTGPVKMKLVDFTRMIGGGYFFLPGRATLRYLAGREDIPATSANVEPMPASLAECSVAQVGTGRTAH